MDKACKKPPLGISHTIVSRGAATTVSPTPSLHMSLTTGLPWRALQLHNGDLLFPARRLAPRNGKMRIQVHRSPDTSPQLYLQLSNGNL